MPYFHKLFSDSDYFLFCKGIILDVSISMDLVVVPISDY